LHVVYEAGPAGYGLHRRLQQLKINCIVMAPTKTPQTPGPRQQTDRRDAEATPSLHGKNSHGKYGLSYVPRAPKIGRSHLQ